jgi:predicted phage replisome organizer
MSQVKWIKINTDIFDNKKIKLIESLPEADAIFKIWIHLIVLAANSNDNGMIYLSEKMPYTIDMLAIIFNKPINIVKLALSTFQQFDMITISENNYIMLNDWSKHQNVEGLDKIREQNRIRQQRFVENQKKSIEE